MRQEAAERKALEEERKRVEAEERKYNDELVGLENKLHTRLNNQRMNKVNLRKEFFRVSLDELEQLVYEIDPTAEFVRTMVAEEYRQSLSSDSNYTADQEYYYGED